MKRMILFSFILLFSMTQAMERSYETNSSDAAYFEAGKSRIAKMKQVAAIGSVTSGIGFFVATASRHSNWPYRFKRMPLFAFISFNAIGQMPIIAQFDQHPQRVAFIGKIMNKKA